MHTSDSGLDRRAFLRGSALGGIWLCASPARAFVAADEPPARAVIQVFLEGGLSHIDTFDPKPDAPADFRGEFGTVASAAGGAPFSEVIPRIAKIADRLTIVRSLTHGEADHSRGVHTMLTGYRPSPAIVYPSMGSVVAHELGGRDDLPAYVCVPRTGAFRGTGYLSAAWAPFELGGDPSRRDFRVRDLAPPKGVDPERLARRRALLDAIDGEFAGRSDAVDASAAFREQAWTLLESEQGRAAFDIAAEPDAVRDRYGRTAIGQRLLLARRLVEAGVRFVHVTSGGYDHHTDVFQGLRARMAEFDPAFAALVEDLDERGLLDSTLVSLTTEFGRTPRINGDAGRDHWPRVFSVVLAGGGFRRGYVHGASNATGSEPARDPVPAQDLAATIYRQLGIDPERKLLSPGNRPVDIVRDARIVPALVGEES